MVDPTNLCGYAKRVETPLSQEVADTYRTLATLAVEDGQGVTPVQGVSTVATEVTYECRKNGGDCIAMTPWAVRWGIFSYSLKAVRRCEDLSNRL
jgi:hypothetical protein